jgi:dTDP-4-dehydrorhamnose 3,5-epimerase
MSLERPGETTAQGNGIALVEEARGALTFQSYAQAPAIHDVALHPIRKHRADNGWFMELFRLREGVFSAPEADASFEVRQLSLSRAAPGRINAFHVHPRHPQNEFWTVIEGQLLVWLVDCREGSPSAGRRQKVVLSGEDPRLLYIPAGVAHGYRAAEAGAMLLYAMDQQFDVSDPNEGRLPWDHFGRDLWEEDRG